MKHNPYATANASAMTIAIVYVACWLLVGLFPVISMQVITSWFHGLNIGGGGWNLGFPSFILGIVSATVTAWLVGFLFAKVFNYFLKH